MGSFDKLRVGHIVRIHFFDAKQNIDNRWAILDSKVEQINGKQVQLLRSDGMIANAYVDGSYDVVVATPFVQAINNI